MPKTFFDTVYGAARRVGRPLRELERTGHPLDYPVTFDEGAYLKCLSAYSPLNYPPPSSRDFEDGDGCRVATQTLSEPASDHLGM